MDTNVHTPQAMFFNPIRYEIPPFQRPYIWTQEQQWEPLWEDLSSLAETLAASGQAEPHFLGAIVLQLRHTSIGQIPTREVVDGQQRLTTIQLLLDAIQEFCVEAGFDGSAARLNGLVLNPEAFIGSDLSPNPPKGCGHADVVRDEGGMNGWCGFDRYGFDRVWALEAHQWEVDDPGWR